ncbi:MAG: hypothetical protein ACYCXC_00070 [Acidovorax defluvii]
MGNSQDSNKPVAWPHVWGCRANAGGECDKGCTAPQPAVAMPEGYALVPVEPTQAMLDAAGMCVVPEGKEWLDASNRETWAAMLAAAPEAPQPAKQPLIDDEICDSWEFITGHQIQFGPSSEGRQMYLSTDEVIEFARAIERAHGIGGQP